MRFAKSKSFLRQQIAARVSSVSRYCDQLIQWLPHPWDDGDQLEHCDCPTKHRSDDLAEIERWTSDPDSRTAILLNGNFNHHYDIHKMLADLKPSLGRGSRVIAICYNPYLRLVFRMANALGLRDGPLPTTFVTHSGLASIARTAGYEVVRARLVGHCPFKLFGLGALINRVFAGISIVRNLALVSVLVLRPVKRSEQLPSLSILIPARDERDNIEAALGRLPDFGGAEIEIIFVEGHSTDGTWEEIQRVIEAWKGRFDCVAFQQTGVGKADAVRLGLGKATKELVAILDADLTMPPEYLSRYYDAYCRGLADFINGSRLVYPVQGDAMRPLNRLGNVFFAKALSLILDIPISDALCGTKLLSRRDCERFVQWRRDFGEFDPFGDFELLFPAATMALGSVDIAVRYRDRTYGSTSIRRFVHGFELLKMTAIGFFRLKFGP
jgi:hypothetical protein